MEGAEDILCIKNQHSADMWTEAQKSHPKSQFKSVHTEIEQMLLFVDEGGER